MCLFRDQCSARQLSGSSTLRVPLTSVTSAVTPIAGLRGGSITVRTLTWADTIHRGCSRGVLRWPLFGFPHMQTLGGLNEFLKFTSFGWGLLG